MWSTVLILAGSVIFEPIRLGLVILLLNRRRPLLQLFVFLCGGLTMGLGVGLVVLFALRATPVIGHLTVAEVQVGCGLIALLIAVVLPANIVARKAVPGVPAAGAGAVAVLERPSGGVQRLAERARSRLQGDALHVAAISGLAAALPSANYLGSMAAILASHAAPLTQVQALLAFNLVAFTVAELPLVGYLAAPQRTRALTAALQAWLRSPPRRDAAALVATGGCFMLALGLSHL
ncbi:putative integral membrane protein [Mycobacterium bohemicum DSM 44277]|uniref:Putative integral membrane protein n=1 Tax=Mycobacterium bohemicum DSM 44277 TaxID=1236609 RepID=A0A0U0W7S4_MYCBE|nr:GAP family protein [Mycobacterium bohemicum]CPR10834.1 putative integral membrane protein [Mycobacterium bohemicum DSM 44277]